MIAMDVLTALLVASAVFAQPDKPRWEPIPICDDCVPRELIVAPGVGIDLTSSYGTAAVRFNNKSIVNIDQIYSNKKYNAIIKELSGPADPEKHPKYGNILDELRDIWRKNQRRLRKLRGLPATPEVGIIGDLIKQLRTATEARLGKPIASAVLATPRLPRVTDEDLDDAMAYAGLKNLKSYRTWTYVSEPQATFAGMGFGLCEKWGDIEKCEDEEATFPVAHVLSVTFTHDVLSATYITAQDARTVSFGRTTTRYDLGLGTWLQNSGSPTYWNEIREAIHRIAIISLPLIDYLLLSGEDATNEQFLETVKEALVPITLGNAPGIVRTSINPLHAGAEGAAEFAKRWQGGTWNCMEPPRCAGNWQPGDDGWRGSWSELRGEL